MDKTYRRTIIVGLGSSLAAGCLNLLPNGPEQTETEEQPPINHENSTESVQSSPQTVQYPTVTVTQSKELNVSGLQLEITVEKQFKKSHPAHLEAALSNTGDERVDIEYGAELPIEPQIVTHENGYGEVALLTEDGENVDSAEGDGRALIPDSSADKCWRITDDSFTVESIGASGLDPGESVARMYVLLAGYENENCFPLGEYPVTGAHYVGGERQVYRYSIRLDERSH